MVRLAGGAALLVLWAAGCGKSAPGGARGTDGAAADAARAPDAGGAVDARRPADASARDGARSDGAQADAGARRDASAPDASAPDGGAVAWDPGVWPMFGHDVRRTGRARVTGPQRYTPGAAGNWTYVAHSAASINMQAVVTAQGAYFGSWGILRRAPATSPDTWIKADGKYFGLGLATGSELFSPFDPAPVAACYRYAPRTPLARDQMWCGSAPWVVTFYNGTIEGTALVDPASGVHYVGRGDGALYAVEPASGRVLWRFATFNPADRADPDGGGEIIGGPVMDARRNLYFATWGAPTDSGGGPLYETHAVYAVDAAGQLVWRYPAAAPRLTDPLLAAPALSPDGRTLYVATWFSDATRPGRLLALDLTAPAGATDAERLRWELVLRNPARAGMPAMWARHLSVGADGTVYVGAAEAVPLASAAAILAVRDEGRSARLVWSPAVVEPHGWSGGAGQMVQGIALWEEGGVTRRIYAATSHTKNVNGTGGALFLLDPQSGRVLATFDPAMLPTPGVGGMTAPTLGDDETVYVGIRGRHDLVLGPEVTTSQWRDGAMYAVKLDASGARFEVRWSRPVEGQLDWAHPALGPDGALYFGSSDRFSPLDQATFYSLSEEPPRHSPRFYAVRE